MGLPGLQMVHELNGLACHGLTPLHKPNQTIMRSRTSGEDTSDLAATSAAIANMAGRAAYDARQQGLLPQRAVLFVSTSKHKPGYASWYEEVKFVMPTYDSGHIISAVLERFQ